MKIINVIEELKKRELTISSVESFTGGLFASSITEIPGVSKIYLGTLVSYSTKIKKDVLNVDSDVLNNYGVISKECAEEMLVKGKEMFNSNIVVSFTGNAGPDSMENKEAGLIYIGICINDSNHIYELNIKKERNVVRKEAVKFAFDKIYELLK